MWDDDATCSRRGGREAQQHISSAGSWESRSAKIVLQWHKHLRRRHVQSWATDAFHTQDSRWLQLRRLASGSLSSFAGALGSRERAGKPHIRFEDGVRFLKSKYADSEDEGS